MNVIDLLKQDHRRAEQLFSEFTAATGENVDKREELFQQIERELLIHGEIEEQIFYPAVKNQAEDQVEESLKEHHQVRDTLAEMLEYDVDEEEFDARMIRLVELVRRHVQEEESADGVLEKARNLGSRILDELGTQIARKRELAERDLAA